MPPLLLTRINDETEAAVPDAMEKNNYFEMHGKIFSCVFKELLTNNESIFFIVIVSFDANL